MVVIPPHNLGPNSGKWGTAITKLLNELQSGSAKAQQTADRAVKSANDVLNAVVQTNTAITDTQNGIKYGQRQPAKAENIATSSANGWDALGNPAPTVTISWDAVSTGVDGEFLPISSYEVWWKTGSAVYKVDEDGITTTEADPAAYTRLAAVHTNALTTNVESNTAYSFIARAVSVTGVAGIYSDPSDITSVSAGATILAPSAPTVTQTTGVVSVLWNGNLVSGGTPSYFRYVKVLQATGSSTGTYTDTGQTLSGEGGVAISGLVDGTSYYYKLQAVDSAGHASGLSAASAAIVPEGVDLSALEAQLDTASQDAANALSTANSAQTGADAASQAAADAAGIANSKAVVLYQTTAPSAAYQNSLTLWIDTTSNANTPKRWNGSTWVAVTDKVATDAANTAATAQTAAATAQTTANTAVANAAAADSKAVTAQSTADGKNTIYYQTAMPTGGTYKDRDIWFDTDDGYKMYVRVGTTWTASQLGSNAIATGAVTSTQIATAVNNAITAAQTSATAADAKAVTAQGTADTAKTNAATAQTAADNAASAASAAAGIANSKGKVLIQSTTPVSADQLAQNLWIDTTGGANTPKRWSGSAWVVVTDKAATDAASAAVAAQSTADTAKTNAATAQAKADSAFANAATAQTTANNAASAASTANTNAGNAQTTANTAVSNADAAQTKANQASTDAAAAAGIANGKGKVVYSTTAPTGADAAVTTLWINTTGNANTPMRWVSGTTWTAVTDKAATDAASAAASANTAAGAAQTTANTAVTNAATAKSAADAAQAKADSAFVNAGNAQTTANGKNAVYYATAAPTGGTYKDNDIWFDTDDGYKMYRRSGSSWLATQFDTSAIATGAITATQIATAVNNAIAQAQTDATAANANALSRGTDLVTNGTAYLRDNTNFSSFTFDVDAPVGTNGSFRAVPENATLFSDTAFPVDTSRQYLLRAQVKTKNPVVGSHFYIGLAPQDAYGVNLEPRNYEYVIGSDTVTTAAVNPGDTVVKVASTTGWAVGTYFYIGFWNFTDQGGRVWPQHTFTRNWAAFDSTKNTATTITLSAPWAGPVIPSGTPTSRMLPGGNYLYIAASNVTATSDWQTVQGGIGPGVHNGATSGASGGAWDKFPPGTSQAKVLILANRDVVGAQQMFAGISFSDAQAAQVTANGKNQVTYSANSPTGLGTTEGDQWWRYSGNVLIGYWRWSGTAWVSQTLDNATIANLDAGKITAGFISAARIQANTITGTMIAGTTITADKLVAKTITAASGVIADAAIGTAQIANLAVTDAQIANGAITNASIADATIQSAKIAALDAGKITSGFISAARIQANTITSAMIAANTIVAADMAVGTITAASGVIADAAITNAKIADSTITNAKISTLDAGKITTGFLSAARIATGTITSAMIAANTIVAGDIAAGTITATEIAGNTITAAKIAGGTITANELATGAVTAGKINATAIDGMTITGATVQTTVTASRGIKINSAGLSAYNSSGTRTVFIDPSTGALTATSGTFSGQIGGAGIITTYNDGTFDQLVSINTGSISGTTVQISNGASSGFDLDGSFLTFRENTSTIKAQYSGDGVGYSDDATISSLGTLFLVGDGGTIKLGPANGELHLPTNMPSAIMDSTKSPLMIGGTSGNTVYTATGIDPSYIPGIDASKITSGTLDSIDRVRSDYFDVFERSTTRSSMPPGTRVGQHATVYNDSTPANNGDYVWDGSAWKPGARTAAFSITATVAQSLAPGLQKLTTTYGASPDVNIGFTSWSSQRLTIAIKGVYTVIASVATSLANDQAQIWINGVQRFTTGVPVATIGSSAVAVALLNPGDYIEVYSYNSNTRTVDTAFGNTHLDVALLSAQ